MATDPAKTVLLIGLALVLAGCRARAPVVFDPASAYYQEFATEIEYPDVASPERPDLLDTRPPKTVGSTGNIEFWPLTLQEAIQIALSNSRAMRNVGAQIVSAPGVASTIYDPAIQETDPRRGPEAALSAFDADFTTSLFLSRDERTLNNALLGGFLPVFRRSPDLLRNHADFLAEISKTAATGTQFSVRNITNYERNNANLNRFPSYYETVFLGEFRHPLLQGSGIEFNRIAGPRASPGAYNGVLIARTNTDISLADFEAAVRDLIGSVERIYWDLYFAYRDVDVRTAGVQAALANWRNVQRRFQAGDVDREQEARAREQYYALEAQRLNALSGGSAGGLPIGANAGGLAVSRSTGLFTVERRLRQIMGLPATDGRTIRPADEPPKMKVLFDWESALEDAVWRRVELRRQRWMIKRRELELIAARNFTKMRLDLVGQYGWRGFGDDLFGSSDVPQGSAFDDLFDGRLHEWGLGLQLATPIGNRIGHMAVRNAELNVARERVILEEQELVVTHELSDAVADVDRVYSVARANLNRFVASRQALDELRAKHESGLIPLELLLDAQRRAVETEAAYYRTLVDYARTISDVHRARGTLLDYHNIALSEGPWSLAAHQSAAKQARRFRPRHHRSYEAPGPVSAGAYPQKPLDEPSDPAEDLSALDQAFVHTIPAASYQGPIRSQAARLLTPASLRRLPPVPRPTAETHRLAAYQEGSEDAQSVPVNWQQVTSEDLLPDPLLGPASYIAPLTNSDGDESVRSAGLRQDEAIFSEIAR